MDLTRRLATKTATFAFEKMTNLPGSGTKKTSKGHAKSDKSDKSETKRHRKMGSDIISRPALRRIAHRGGVKRIAGNTYEIAREDIENMMHNVIKSAVQCVKYAKRHTLMKKDIQFALARFDRHVLV